MVWITSEISVDEKEIKLDFIRASGPGGQNVNKVATAVQLRFDVQGSPSLPEAVRERLKTQARNRITDDGVLVIKAARYRTQIQNREDAIDRLVELIRKASVRPKIRIKRKRSAASKRRMLEAKRRRSSVKQLRKKVGRTDQ